MRQFLVIDSSTGQEQKVADTRGISHGIFQGVPAFDDHRHRLISVPGCTYSETALLEWVDGLLGTAGVKREGDPEAPGQEAMLTVLLECVRL